MPLGMTLMSVIPEKMKEYEKTIRKKEERITALETENAMLYLRLAQIQGSLRNSKEEKNHLRRLFEADHMCKDNLTEIILNIDRQAKEAKCDLLQLRSLVEGFPQQFVEDCDDLLNQAERIKQNLLCDNMDLKELKLKVYELENALAETKERLTREKRRRRALHNTLVELRGNIRVHCRVRPLMPFDSGSEDINLLGRVGSLSEQVVHATDDEIVNVKLNRPGHTVTNKTFEYERVYAPHESQDAVFEEVQPLLTSLLDGYNVCIMAYGQTGSGKTHTMLGSHDPNDDIGYSPNCPCPTDGVIPKAARELFRLINEKPLGTHTIEVSVVEVYNNDIRDLLSSGVTGKHDVMISGDGSSHDVPSLLQRHVETAEEVVSLVQFGMKHRHEDATLIHAHSSRSHLVVTLTVTASVIDSPPTPAATSRTGSPTDIFATPLPPKEHHRRQLPSLSLAKVRSRSPSPIRSSSPPSCLQPTTSVVKTKLQLVDLAGSECVGMSGVTGAALRETSFINKSLCALADVLGALAESRSRHVPYRNSKLTQLLQDSIGGDAKLLVMLCVSPSQRYMSETLQCLGFGSRARQVQKGPIKKKGPTPLTSNTVSGGLDQQGLLSSPRGKTTKLTALAGSNEQWTNYSSGRNSPKTRSGFHKTQ